MFLPPGHVDLFIHSEEFHYGFIGIGLASRRHRISTRCFARLKIILLSSASGVSSCLFCADTASCVSIAPGAFLQISHRNWRKIVTSLPGSRTTCPHALRLMLIRTFIEGDLCPLTIITSSGEGAALFQYARPAPVTAKAEGDYLHQFIMAALSYQPFYALLASRATCVHQHSLLHFVQFDWVRSDI